MRDKIVACTVFSGFLLPSASAAKWWNTKNKQMMITKTKTVSIHKETSRKLNKSLPVLISVQGGTFKWSRLKSSCPPAVVVLILFIVDRALIRPRSAPLRVCSAVGAATPGVTWPRVGSFSRRSIPFGTTRFLSNFWIGILGRRSASPCFNNVRQQMAPLWRRFVPPGTPNCAREECAETIVITAKKANTHHC